MRDPLNERQYSPWSCALIRHTHLIAGVCSILSMPVSFTGTPVNVVLDVSSAHGTARWRCVCGADRTGLLQRLPHRASRKALASVHPARQRT
jgi:hypothetical protein